VVRSWDRHPLGALRRAGVLVTVNSDDPALFGTSLAGEWNALSSRLHLAAEEIVAIGADTVRASFADEEIKASLLAGQERAFLAAGSGG
jgi:adenosine deaminase